MDVLAAAVKILYANTTLCSTSYFQFARGYGFSILSAVRCRYFSCVSGLRGHDFETAYRDLLHDIQVMHYYRIFSARMDSIRVCEICVSNVLFIFVTGIWTMLR